MSKQILQPSDPVWVTRCLSCGCTFTYETSEDVHLNVVFGGEWVACPSCGRECPHAKTYEAELTMAQWQQLADAIALHSSHHPDEPGLATLASRVRTIAGQRRK